MDGSFVKLTYDCSHKFLVHGPHPSMHFVHKLMHMSGFVEKIILQNELSLCILLDVEVYVYGRALRT